MAGAFNYTISLLKTHHFVYMDKGTIEIYNSAGTKVQVLATI